MSVITEPSNALLRETRDAWHAHCVVCGRAEPDGLGLAFEVLPDGAVQAQFDCPLEFEGYDDMLHGGVISAIADGAMTNCLFAHGVRAVTAELKVRFRHPVRLGEPLRATARIVRCNAPLFLLEVAMTQNGRRKATATGKFMQIHEP
jgi:uncharacterized protein (TIGR00369 family)